MRIAVTGGSGKIGTYVCEELAKAGHDVVSLDRVPPKGEQAYKTVDLLSLEAALQALEGCEQVVHLAAIPNPMHDPPERVIGENTVTSHNVFEAARRLSIRRVVYGCSESSSGFGIHTVLLRPLYVPIDEEHPLWPHECYSLSKHFGERIAETYARSFGMETLSLRYTWVWPQGRDPALAELVRRSRSGEFSPQGAWFGAYIAVRDVATAVRAACEYRFPQEQETRFEAFYLTARDTFYPIPTLDVLRAIYGELPPVKDPGYFSTNPCASLFDIRKAERLLAWRPAHRWQDFEEWEK